MHRAHIQALIERIEGVEELAAEFPIDCDGHLDVLAHAWELETGQTFGSAYVEYDDLIRQVAAWLHVDPLWIVALVDGNDEGGKAAVLQDLRDWVVHSVVA